MKDVSYVHKYTTCNLKTEIILKPKFHKPDLVWKSHFNPKLVKPEPAEPYPSLGGWDRDRLKITQVLKLSGQVDL